MENMIEKSCWGVALRAVMFFSCVIFLAYLFIDF